MDSKIIKKLILFLVIAIAFYAVILAFSDFQLILESINQIHLEFFPYIFSLLAMQILLGGLKFHRLLHQLQMSIPFRASIKIFLLGFAMGVTPGGGGTLIKSYILKKDYKKSISSTMPVIFIEKITDLLSIIVIMTILLIWTSFYEAIIILGIGYGLFLFIMILISNNKIFLGFKNFISKIKLTKKFTANLEESKISIKTLLKSQNFLESLAYSIIIKFIQLFIVFFVFLSLDINLELFLSGQIYYTSLLFGVLTFIPAGLVVTDSSMIGLLIRQNIELPSATVSVLLIRLITTWIPVGLGLIMFKFLLNEKTIKE